MELRFGRTRILVTPDLLGAQAAVQPAVDEAATAPPDTEVPLGVTVDQATTAAFIAKLAKRFDRPAADSKLVLRNGRPLLTKERIGVKVNQRKGVHDTVAVLNASERRPVILAARHLKAKVTRANFGPVIVIHRGENRLFLYDGMRFERRSDASRSWSSGGTLGGTPPHRPGRRGRSRSRRGRVTHSAPAGWASRPPAWAFTARRPTVRLATRSHTGAFACTSPRRSGSSTT